MSVDFSIGTRYRLVGKWENNGFCRGNASALCHIARTTRRRPLLADAREEFDSWRTEREISTNFFLRPDKEFDFTSRETGVKRSASRVRPDRSSVHCLLCHIFAFRNFFWKDRYSKKKKTAKQTFKLSNIMEMCRGEMSLYSFAITRFSLRILRRIGYATSAIFARSRHNFRDRD